MLKRKSYGRYDIRYRIFNQGSPKEASDKLQHDAISKLLENTLEQEMEEYDFEDDVPVQFDESDEHDDSF